MQLRCSFLQALTAHVQESAQTYNVEPKTMMVRPLPVPSQKYVGADTYTKKIQGVMRDMDNDPLILKIANSTQYRERLCSVCINYLPETFPLNEIGADFA
jgi:hypothetical protein